MEKENTIKIIANDLGFKFTGEEGDYRFSIFSPEGQDCNIESSGTTFEEIVNSVMQFAESFDVSYETYIWLDNFGHGKNGAPYDMRDCYNDMEWFKKKAEGLANNLLLTLKANKSNKPEMMSGITATVTNHSFMIDFSFEGEGYYGDYENDKENDIPLLRLNVYMEHYTGEIGENGLRLTDWNDLPEYSLCTNIGARMSIKDAKEVLSCILEQLTGYFNKTKNLVDAVHMALSSKEVESILKE